MHIYEGKGNASGILQKMRRCNTRARISRSSTRHSPIFPPSSGQRARCTGPASTPAAAAPSAASPTAISEPAPAKAGVRAYRVARYLQLPGNLPDRMASAFQLVNLFQLSTFINTCNCSRLRGRKGSQWKFRTWLPLHKRPNSPQIPASLNSYQYLWCTSAESPLMMPPSSSGSIPTCYFCGCSAIRSDLHRR